MIELPQRRGSALLGTIAAVLTTLSAVGIFFVAPEDADQGIIQKIFYFHVSIALVSLAAFMVGAIAGVQYLRTRREDWDDMAVAAIGIGLVFTFLTVITGSIWAKASWGHWWVWSDVRLVTYTIVALLYSAYFLLRSSSEGERRMRSSAIFAIAAFASVPVSFWSVRIAKSAIHPVVFRRDGASIPGSMMIWFLLSLAAMAAIFWTMVTLEMSQRRTERNLRRLKLALENR
jgi:heme exporter protein C